ncbi:hypothetical protein IEO21_08873 [Rhodonia placenta]|uniref:Uncharacterized protein n=1 Tax=Rhodonia placenta TaxID=104341 RepID=A0A8H7NVT4_9APHY|nr:hypothetical protein IEO21_08873 [Postia placenta]
MCLLHHRMPLCGCCKPHCPPPTLPQSRMHRRSSSTST